MPLLLQHVGLRLPFPHQHLLVRRRRDGQPVAARPDAHAGDRPLGRRKGVQHVPTGHGEQAEDAVRVADDKHPPAELGTDDFAALLPNKEAPHRLPPLLLPLPSLLRPLSRSLLPSPDVHCGVPRHRVHRVALEPQGIVEPSPQAVDLAGAFHDQARHHGLSMARQHHRATMLGAFPPQPMQTQRHVVSRRHERARVAAPDAAADDSVMSG
mmetsp:Transcript_13476/g.50168  ORF Transcript_13476/g.50168 Transcript_13476/m.50168 type:complete len:211 (+) Transcript_13476:1658-2290(+)